MRHGRSVCRRSCDGTARRRPTSARPAGRATDIASWLRADDPYPIVLVEFNSLEETGAWQRAYGDFEDGYHRAERAIVANVPTVFATIREFRFMPPGKRPPDRTGYL